MTDDGSTRATGAEPPADGGERGPWAVGATIAAIALYLLAVHVLLVTGAIPLLTLAVIVLPWVATPLSGLVFGGRPGTRALRRSVAAASIAGLALLAWLYGERLARHADDVLYLENLAFLATLAGVFALSLRPGREALVTRLARVARGDDMPPRVVRYTRAVTVGWTVFFLGAALLSTLLFFTQSRTVWSSFVNLALGPLVAGAFLFEYGLRVRVLRGMEHGTLMAGVTAFRHRDRVDARGDA